MGQCGVSGLRVLHEDLEDGELSPRSTTSRSSSSSSVYGSASSEELDTEVEAASAADRFSHPDDGALWRCAIPHGRRCRPLSFAGMIVYDQHGKQVPLAFVPEDADDADDADDEYFSSQTSNLSKRWNELQSSRVAE